MKQTVYIDALISVNLLVDYFLLYAAAQLSGRPISRPRLCLAAIIGAASSCMILLPPLPSAVNLAVAAVTALLMTLAAFRWSGVQAMLRSAGSLLLVTVCYGGLMTALWAFVAPPGLMINNGAVYIDIPPLTIILVTVISYTIVTLCARVMRRRNLRRSRCSVDVASNGRSVRLEAIIDTGNLLSEPFSGLPVIIAEYDAVSQLLPDGFARLADAPQTATAAAAGVRVVPYSGIGGKGVMLAFKPDKLSVELSGRKSHAQAYIGVLREGHVGRGYSAIINPDAVLC